MRDRPVAGPLQPAPHWPPPPADLTLRPDEVHVWRAALDVTGPCLSLLRDTLSADEHARAGRFVFPRDRDHFIAGRGVLRRLLGRYLSRDPSRLSFHYLAAGKPTLLRDVSEDELHFNVSHSHGLALFAFARGRAVGVDLEAIRDNYPGDDIARRFFSPREVAALQALPPELRTEAFFACWTRKEAFIKAIGTGLSLPLDRFDVSVNPGEPVALLATRFEPAQASRWQLRELRPATGYQGALAVEGTGWELWCFGWAEPFAVT